jgi:hypothetical protein
VRKRIRCVVADEAVRGFIVNRIIISAADVGTNLTGGICSNMRFINVAKFEINPTERTSIF